MLKGEKMVKIYLKGKEKECFDVSFLSIIKVYFLASIFWTALFWGLMFLFIIIFSVEPFFN